MNKRMKNLLYFLFLTVVLVSCKTAELGFKVTNVSGMIYDFSNRPVPQCEISLGWWHKSTTDINGRFTLPKIAYGTYTVTGKKNGFEVYSDKVIINDTGQIIYIRIPSQNQLLNMVDEALTANDFTLAEETVQRAYQIDKNNIETLFYYATVKFRQREYCEAVKFLEAAKNLGSRDLYIDKFLTLLKELT
jgi:hypothetical protein